MNRTALSLRRLCLASLAALALLHCGPADDLPDADDDSDFPGVSIEETSTPEEVNPSRAAVTSMPPCGSLLASWDGVGAYSNGSNSGTGISCAGQGKYGNRYQCVELVMRYFKKHYNVIWSGNAKVLLDKAPKATVDVHKNGDSKHPPRPGDMIVWPNGTYGHVALITAVHASSIDIIEQNVGGGTGRASLPYDGKGTVGARWGNWVPTGWAHAKANPR